MGFARVTVVVPLMIILVGVYMLQVTAAAVYKVGDSAGWTTIGNVDYKQWAATKTFNLGDVILFEYNPQFHNVMQVNHTEYRSCTPNAPIATYTTGNDSVTITTPGHHFFMCGVPGHCQSGQKVDINVLRTPFVAPPPPSPTSPAPAPNSVPSLYAPKGVFVKIGMCMALFATFLLGF